MQFLPNEAKVDEMLRSMGKSTIEDLYADVPKEVQIDGLKLPPGMPELEVAAEVGGLLSEDVTPDDFLSFLGAGMYDHFIPATVPALVTRSEFLTSYTPYQPEASQGMLQAMFEYQSLVCALTGMEVANISMYDGATAMAEAALMAARITGKDRVVVPKAMDPEKRSVLHNYTYGAGLKIVEVPYDATTGQIDRERLVAAVDAQTACVYLESPNFFGCIEEALVDVRPDLRDALLVVGTHPVSLGILKPPGDLGADIVVADGQGIGVPMSLGGPSFGLFATRKKHARQMPGRIIGLSKDDSGRRAFHMALQTREQHIRRSKATSNICTNENLMALSFAVHLATVGRQGLVRMAKTSAERAHYLAKAIDAIDGFHAPHFRSHFFNEFTVRTDHEVGALVPAMMMEAIFIGVPLKRHFPELGEAFLMATTERHTRADLDDVAVSLRAFHDDPEAWAGGGEE